MKFFGTVASYSGTFGFIHRDDKQPDVFVTGSALKLSGLQSLERFQRVEFDTVPNPRKPGRLMAENIKLVEGTR